MTRIGTFINVDVASSLANARNAALAHIDSSIDRIRRMMRDKQADADDATAGAAALLDLGRLRKAVLS